MACNCNEEGKIINIGMGCCVPVVANADAYYTKSEIDEKLDIPKIWHGTKAEYNYIEHKDADTIYLIYEN